MNVELLSTRANPMIDPALHVWGWEIPVYLFLGGWVAGMLVLSGWRLITGALRRARCACGLMPWMGLLLLSVGMLALFLDLEHKLHVWRLYVTFEPTSPMSWGAWILLLIYPVLVAQVVARPPALLVDFFPALGRLSDRLTGSPRALAALGWLSVASGVALGIYTGVLLGSLGARPLWNSALLGPLFLVSGLSAGAAFGHLVAGDPEERAALARIDIAALVVEVGLVGLMLLALLGGATAHREAAGLLLGGPYTAVFWVLAVGLGMLLPIVVQGLAVSHRIAHTPVAPLLVLAGGLALRFVIVYAGQASHWARA